MKQKSLYLLVFTAFMAIICFITVFVFTLPSFNNHYDLSSNVKANIGTTISGITAPVIGIFSAILVYLAFTAQTESNNEQRLKNESDIIFLLINQFNEEVNGFYIKSTKGETIIEQRGVIGLHSYAKGLKFGANFSNTSVTFKQFEEAKYINLYVDSFKLIKKRIEISNLTPDLKGLFAAKLNSYYYTMLRLPLKFITEVAEKYPNIKDSFTEKFQTLYDEQLGTY
jgi:hypothetical protein